MRIVDSTLQFLKDVQLNNERSWFNENKSRYLLAKDNVRDFVELVASQLQGFDEIDGVKHFRIYRDVRFSKDKSPYKNSLSAGIRRSGPTRRGGMYFHLQPLGQTFVGGGFWKPEKHDLERIRKEFDVDAEPMRLILGDKTFKETFGALSGDRVKTAPKGYNKDHPNIDLIRHKSYTIGRSFTDAEVLHPQFLDEVVETFKRMYPFFNYFSEILTTDLNGETTI